MAGPASPPRARFQRREARRPGRSAGTGAAEPALRRSLVRLPRLCGGERGASALSWTCYSGSRYSWLRQEKFP